MKETKKKTRDTSEKIVAEVVIERIDLQNELVVIKNMTQKAIDLTGWQLVSAKGEQTFEFPIGYTLDAGASVEIASGRSEGDIKWTGKHVWNNEGQDAGILYDENGMLVFRLDN